MKEVEVGMKLGQLSVKGEDQREGPLLAPS